MLSFLFIVWLSIALAYVVMDIVLAFRVLQIKSIQSSTSTKGISLIIAARNEAGNLKQNLTSILQQQHSKFEVVVVNDNSTDDTTSILKDFKKRYSNFRYFSMQSDEPSKKKALTLGIKNSKFNTLCFTDADCRPVSPLWLSKMENYISTRTPLVLGFSPYAKSGRLLNKLIRFETLQTAINYFGFAKLGMPYMAVGRNLMYTKDVFKSANGFKCHAHIKSGDDDLLVNAVSSKYNMALCLDPDTFVESTPKTSMRAWVTQKRRHISTSTYYKTQHQVVLGTQYFTRFLFWYFALPLSWFWVVSDFGISGVSIVVVASLIILKSIFWYTAFQRFKDRSLIYLGPVLEFLLLHVQLYVFLSNLRRPKKDW